jgi:hypothetical protein
VALPYANASLATAATWFCLDIIPRGAALAFRSSERSLPACYTGWRSPAPIAAVRDGWTLLCRWRRRPTPYVLRTNSKLNTLSVALAYRELWKVEAIFRSAKAILETRPIYNQSDATIAGHLFCSFLALSLR